MERSMTKFMNCNKDADNDVHLLMSKYTRYLLLPLMLWVFDRKIALLCTVSLFIFFRSPDRRVFHTKEEDSIVSPADGIVLNVSRDSNNVVVSIFLSVFDVHVQYAPINGTIVKQRYVKGRFHPAYILEKSDYNERMYTDLMTSDGHIVSVVQIAGQVANRIESFVKPGDVVSKGCRLGIIKFGSRVDIKVPSDIYVLNGTLKKGDQVWAGITRLFQRTR